MNLHEYQGKELFAKFGLPVSKNKVITSADDVVNACRDIGGNKWVVKAQVHAGGRGKAGGVKLVSSPEEGVEFANHWLGKRLITYQTDSNGQLVNSILVEECTDIAKELYLSAVIDRGSQRIVFIGSSEGGVNIEEVAENTPEKIIYEPIDPLTGPMGFQSRKISKVLGLDGEQSKQFAHPAVIMILSPDGTISRYLYGVSYSARDLKFALIEASEGKIGTTVDKVILSCFSYDNSTGRYTASAFGLMRLAGVITMFFLGAMVTALWRRERRHTQQVSE